MKVSSDIVLQNIQLDLQQYAASFPGCTPRQFSASALLTNVFKKFVDTKSKDADSKALALFLDVNSSLKECVVSESTTDDQLLGQLRKELQDFWFAGGYSLVTHLDDIFHVAKTGPGKSLGSPTNDFYTKLFDCRLTSTSLDLYRSYRASTLSYPRYDAAEKYRAEVHGDVELVGCSKLLFVPKRNDISRTICVEPNLNMFYQLGFGKIIEARLKSFYKIDLSTQPDFNRELARLGSLDASYATIDLSSASDSLSLGVLKDILPKPFMDWMKILRTPSVTLPNGEKHELRMVSTMGNGFTFPLETLIFAAIVVSAYKCHGVPIELNKDGSHGNFGVFGDDIIIRKEIYWKVTRLLELLGFKLNAEKTFVEGPFRESCGSDYFSGHFVRSVYIKSLRTPQDRYVAINLLHDWACTNGLVLYNTIRYLVSTVQGIFVPPYHGLDEGIHVPRSLLSKKRFDRNGSLKYRYYFALPRKIRVSEEGVIGGRKTSNLDGLLLAFLHGTIRSHAIGYRQLNPKYVVKSGISPNWDQMPLGRFYRRFNFTRWETTVFLHLYKEA